MRYGDPQPEAPTHLGSHQLPLPPEWLPAEEFEDDEPSTRAVRDVRAWEAQFDISDSIPTRQPPQRSERPILLERPHPDDLRKEPRRQNRGSAPTVGGHRSGSKSKSISDAVRSGEVVTSAPRDERLQRRAAPAREVRDEDRARAREVRDEDRAREVRDKDRARAREVRDEDRARARDVRDEDLPRRRSSSKQPDREPSRDPSRGRARAPSRDREPSFARGSSRDVSESARGLPPAPEAPKPADSQPPKASDSQPQIDPAAAVMAAMGAIDPMQVPVPPELGGPIYGWVRRLALQADLNGADKVLRDAFLDLTSSLSVAIVYPGEDGLWTLGSDDEIPDEAGPLVAVAQARRAVIASHTALIPVVTSTETVAVVLLTRNPRNPGYHPVEQIAAVALARESAAILHHLAVAHLQRADEIKADRGGLYRGEALEAHRTRGNEGVPVNLSPGWVRRTYPILVVTILVALAASIFITVPTYSSGMGVVIFEGTAITAPTAGTVDKVFVMPGQQVEKDTVLVRLHAADQEADLKQAQVEADALTIQYLYGESDDRTRTALVTSLGKVDRELARLESRLVRARVAGTVSDIRVQQGQLLQTGDHVLQIVDPDAEPEVYAFLPGKDRPRLREGQTLQVELVGYTKSREQALVTHVTPEVIGANEISTTILGKQLADAVKLAPGTSYAWVKAKLPGKSFTTQHRTFWFHHGMPAKTEVKIQSKPFLVTLLPALEKYIPD